MKLDRNLNAEGDGKYALIRKRRIREIRAQAAGGDQSAIADAELMDSALAVLEELGVLDDSVVGTEGEFFVFRLRDVFAEPALRAYAQAVRATGDGDEYAAEIDEMADRSGPHNPHCKYPD
ncbi:ATP phosphoribosyltransferase regulatory subunit HisZ [Ancylobacter sp. 3268]|uniref:hypothetical protein n=1 Tax=Ancylobacter sp. 3268 TaxID=2817752 RepID=UPI002859DB14|nr:hypothetical protein [Ancylobacter sp. 3268]MDR6954201.1 ATP phosphoribosyltransferase regulatory subunit HisZ [Ancylobacter sp. 3268]